MRGFSAKSWLGRLGIAMLILGFVRLPLPASPMTLSGDDHLPGEFCAWPGETCGCDLGSESTAISETSPFSWRLVLLSTLNVSPLNLGDESSEDVSGDSETADPLDDAADSQVSLPRGGVHRVFSRDLSASLDTVGLGSDAHSPSKTPGKRPRAVQNGTSPSFGLALHSLHQRWAC